MNRVVVVETVTHLPESGVPTVVDSRWASLVSDEQPYVRRLTIGEDWTPVDEGWVKRASLLVLSFSGEPRRTSQPTDEERKADDAREIVVGIASPLDGLTVAFAVLRPGESLRVRPIDSKRLVARTATRCICTVHVIPEDVDG